MREIPSAPVAQQSPLGEGGESIQAGRNKAKYASRYWQIVTAILLGAAIFLFVFSPYIGVAFPANVDLPEHIIVSKLFFERLTGISNLDTEISYFLGYRLSPYMIALLIGASNLLGIGLRSLPKLIVGTMILFHIAAILRIYWKNLQDRRERDILMTLGLMLPAIVSIYSACWFIGFVGYMLAVTALVVTIVLTERYLDRGGVINAALLFVGLSAIYMAHPFVEIFWGFWCVGRTISSLVNKTVWTEWKRLIVVAALFLPIFVYNSVMTKGTELALADRPLFEVMPVVTFAEWQTRIGDLINGTMMQADYLADARIFAIVSIFIVLSSLILAYIWTSSRLLRNVALSSFLLLLISTWFNDRVIPSPGALWIAWEYRFTSAVLAVCLAASGFVIVHVAQKLPKGSRKTIAIVALAVIAFVGSLDHIWEVRKAYARHDEPARKFMERVFSREDTAGIWFPRSRWHPDGTLIRLYVCLEEADCNPDGTMFKSLGGNIWAVRLKSLARRDSKPTTAFVGGVGKALGQFSKPFGLHVASDRNIFVADTGNSRIQKFDASGASLMALGPIPGQIAAPTGIAVDASGNIYVVDASLARLVKFDSTGTFVKSWPGPDPGLIGPRDLAIGSNGILYFIDQGRARVVAFDPASEAFASWAGPGESDGLLSEPTGLTAANGLIFVADRGNNRVQVFDLVGKYIRQWPVPEWGKYVWHYPDLAVDGLSNRVLASDGWRAEILVFDINGEAKAPIRPEGAAKPDNPGSIAVSSDTSDRRLFVLSMATPYSDTGKPRITTVKLPEPTKNK